jgi:transaldolase
MVREGEQLAALHRNIVVKVPMTVDGIRAIAHFSSRGIRTNCTLVFSSAQSILAAKAGATYLSPFLGRLDDVGSDGLRLLREITELYQTRGWKTQVLAASIRGPMHVVESAKAGADAVTCPLKTLKELFVHPLTDVGLGIFSAAAKALG